MGKCRSAELTGGEGTPLGVLCPAGYGVPQEQTEKKYTGRKPCFSCSVLSGRLLITFNIVSPEKREMFTGSIFHITIRATEGGFGNER